MNLSTNNRAILLEVSAFLADNNVRRGILTTATNSTSANGTVNDRVMSIGANTTNPVVFAPIDNNKLTLLRTTYGPVTVNVKIGSNLSFIQFQVDSLWVMSTPITELQFLNPTSTNVQVRVLQI